VNRSQRRGSEGCFQPLMLGLRLGLGLGFGFGFGFGPGLETAHAQEEQMPEGWALPGGDAAPESIAPPPPVLADPEPEPAAVPLPPPPPPRQSAGAGKPPPRRAMAPLTPAAPPALPSNAYVHDGFYLRFGAGPVYARTSVRTDRVSQPDVAVRGIGGGFEFWIGGTPFRGITIGGLIGFNQITTDEATVGSGGHAPGLANTALAGVFIDSYPDPHQGFHFGGWVAGAATEVKTEAAGGVGETDFSGGGLALAVFVGLDAWIARQWSFGALLRLGGSLARDRSQQQSGQLLKQGETYGAAVLVSVVYQ